MGRHQSPEPVCDPEVWDAAYSFFSLTFCRAGSWLAPVLRWHKWTQPTVAVSRAAQSASWPKTLSVPGASGWMHVWPMLGSMEGECVCPRLLPAVPGLWLILMSVYSSSVNAALLCMCMCVSSFSATCVSICQSLLTHLSVHLVLPHQRPASLLDLPRSCDWPPHCHTRISFHFIRALKVFSQSTTPSFLPRNTLSSCLLQVFLPASPACLPYWFFFHPASECRCSSGFSLSLYTCTAFLGDFIPIHSQPSAVDNHRCISSWAAEFPVQLPTWYSPWVLHKQPRLSNLACIVVSSFFHMILWFSSSQKRDIHSSSW